MIRVPIPTLTEERRKDLVKLVKKLAEEGRVRVRNIRRDANDELKKLLKDGAHLARTTRSGPTQDMQKLTDRYIGAVDELLKKKTAEVMEV